MPFFDNSGVKKKIEFAFTGISTLDEAKAYRKKSSFLKLKIKSVEAGQTKVSSVFHLNIDELRNILQKENISYITVNEKKIKVSNLITQDKALELSQSVIDVPVIPFDASYNKADNLGYYEFRVYYFESKLAHSMHAYSENLFKGYIDMLQESVKQAKEEKDEFIKQHSN